MEEFRNKKGGTHVYQIRNGYDNTGNWRQNNLCEHRICHRDSGVEKRRNGGFHSRRTVFPSQRNPGRDCGEIKSIKKEKQMKAGDIVKVGLGDNYYLSVITEIDENEEMVRVKYLSQIEDNIQPMRCVRKATVDDMVGELRSIYGYYD
jgi:hypothetical protein